MKNDYEEEEDYSLTLNLGFPSPTPKPQHNQTLFSNKNHLKVDNEPSLTLTLSGEAATAPTEPPCMSTTVSSSVKRERETVSSDEDDGGFGVPTITSTTRKKLRLTKQQSALLEDSFKSHSTPNPKQKQVLADRLNLRPRQVEVWFQNRRARTKLKQTEVDCEYLKKYCETLTDQNRRLEKEVQELKAMKVGPPPPFYMHLPAATLTICPSCERIGGKGVVPSIVGTTNAKNSFSIGPKTHRFIAASPNRPLLVDN